MNKPLLLALPLLLAFAASPALADRDKHEKPKHKGHASQGHAPKAHGRHDNGRHLGWHKNHWKRGDRIEIVAIEPTYYVEDYRTYRLSAPPRGYRWVRPMDDRYLLVEVATGLVIEALGY